MLIEIVNDGYFDYGNPMLANMIMSAVNAHLDSRWSDFELISADISKLPLTTVSSDMLIFVPDGDFITLTYNSPVLWSIAHILLVNHHEIVIAEHTFQKNILWRIFNYRFVNEIYDRWKTDGRRILMDGTKK